MGWAGAVDVRDFGALGDGVADDTAAIRRALAASREVHFPKGVYVLSDGIDLPDSAIVTGEGSPTLGTFPLRDDDKRFLSDGKLRELPGTTLLFTGEGTKSLTTGRNDGFKELRYALRTAPGLPYRISDLAVVMDVRTENPSGKRTTPENDQRADFDVGILVDDSPGGTMRGVSVFGYFHRAGLCVVSRGEGSNPDYNTFWNCSFSGDYGVALIGSDDGPGPGLSGTQFYGCNLFSKDHHHRAGGHWGSGALFIDGETAGVRADINGHYFFGGCIRTYSNVAVRLKRASNISFHSVVFEVPGWDGKEAKGADQTGKVVGTADTRDVVFVGCRMHDIGLDELAKSMTDGVVTVVGGLGEGMSVRSGSNVVRMFSAAKGDPMLQLTRDASSINSGWTMRMDVSDDEALVLRHNNVPAATLSADGYLKSRSISSDQLHLGRPSLRRVVDGKVEVTRTRIALKVGETTALRTLTGGAEGTLVILELAEGSAAISMGSNSAGNLRLTKPFVLSQTYDRITLQCVGEIWIELSRADFE